MTHAEEEFRDLCALIVEEVYRSIGNRLGAEETVRLASQLAVAIILEFAEAKDPVPEMAGDAMESFFRRLGIVDIDDGTGWRWVN